MHEADDAWDRLSKTDEHQVVDPGHENTLEQRKNVVGRREEVRIEERERDVVSRGVDDRVDGFDASVDELDAIAP